jgi:hypothetical protein
MHPEIARSLIAQHHRDLRAAARSGDPRSIRRRPARRRPILPGVPRWRITWSRVAVPAADQGARAWLIVITARSARSARSFHRIA